MLLTSFTTCSSVPNIDCEQVNASWAVNHSDPTCIYLFKVNSNTQTPEQKGVKAVK